MRNTGAPVGFSALLQRFFTERLINQQNVSMRTVASYRDAFRLLLLYIRTQTGIAPSDLTLDHINTDVITAFLKYLEKERHNSIRTRNHRLAAIRSFLQYVSGYEPAYLSTVQRVLAIPMKRFSHPQLGYLTREEMNAILEAPDPLSWSGRRDRVMFATLYNTGARVSEIISIRITDVCLRHSRTVTIQGKGRKERVLPLWKSTIRELQFWLKELPADPLGPLFPNSRGDALSRSGATYRLNNAVCTAKKTCPSLTGKHVSPHTFRHTTAMHLLQSGVDLSVIALWLGHVSFDTTHMYIEADLCMKDKGLAKVTEPSSNHFRFRPSDSLLQFLESL
jgi:site-specific recombinase XerD